MDEHDDLVDIAKYVVSKIKGNSVLDIGTGFGSVVDQIIYNTECKVVSIDPEAWTFDDLEDRHKGEIAKGRLVLMKTGIESFPDVGKEYDTTISLSSLHHLQDPSPALSKIERLTKKRVIIADWNSNSAGKKNPHSPEHLREIEEKVKDHMKAHSYTIEDHENWYCGMKDLS